MSTRAGSEGLIPVRMDLEELQGLGRLLDERPVSLHGDTVAMTLARTWLKVRGRDGATVPLEANTVQRLFERRRDRRNIVLKARQLGLTTWTAARFFLKTITRPGTLTLQVAHSRESAEEIFRIVHRFLEWMPDELRDGPLRVSRANARQIVFPEIDSQYRVVTAGDRNAGRGLTVQNLHCSELARWPKNPAEILAGLRAALAPGAEEILESTPERSNFRGLARQEYAEDAESCFLASGDSVFELEAIEARITGARTAATLRRNGELKVWLPPVPGKEYVVAVDPAGGGSDGDYSAARVEMETGLQCAEFAGHVGGLELAELVTELAREYNGAWLAVERNNHGSGVLALIEQVCKHERVYREGAGRRGRRVG